MSGLEPLVTLSLACNVLQLIEVGRQTITVVKDVYQGKPIDDALHRYATILSSISHEIKAYERSAKCPKHEQQLFAAADKCDIAARDLREEIQFLVENAEKGSLSSALKVVAKTNWRRRRLDRLEENMDSTEKLLHTVLIVRIWSNINIAEIGMLELRSDFRSFIEQYSIGHRSTAELVSRGIAEIGKHLSSISAETTKSLGEVQERLNGLVLDATAQSSQVKRDRLLKSLKFGGLNERRSQVRAAYKDTGKWIFAGDGDETEVVKYPAYSISGGESTESNDFQEETQNREDNTVDIRWDSFSNWLRSTDIFYWISGKPGSGKTTLVKLIVQHPGTEVLLNSWQPQQPEQPEQPRPLIISHFFWRPGTLLQRNIKGMLCSLLYQLLQNNDKVLDSALASFPDLKTKDADTDWSHEELRTLCLQVVSIFKRPICLFLDGLDEVDTHEEVVELLNWVQEELSQRKNIKICLSSRPEPLLQRRLSGYPRLRLQDLNRRDLESYAQDHVRLPGWTSKDSDSYNPVRSLVDKAEGIFMWLVLAINSINKGAEYGDTIELVNTRIRKLPGNLVEMYKDMWKRTCADDPMEYRQTAALYFKLMLLHRGNNFIDYQLFFDGLDFFTFVLATTSLADEIIDHGDATPACISQDKIIQTCRAVERRLNVYCFGLVELQPLPRGHPDRTRTLGLYGNDYDRILPSSGGNKLLHFIHRSAHDFLLDTTEGMKILESDTSSKISLDIRLIKAYMASSQIFMRGEGYTKPGILFASVPLYFLRALRLTYQGTNDWLVADWRMLARYCEFLCNTEKLVAGSADRARLCKGDDFLKVAANSCCHERTSLAIKEKTLNKDIRSEILLNACNLPTFTDHYGIFVSESRDYTVEETVRNLLLGGADPNWKGVIFSPDLWFGPFAQLETPFTRYLVSTILLTVLPGASLYGIFAFLETLRDFINCKAHLDDMVNMLIRIENSDRPGRTGSSWVVLPSDMTGLNQVDDWPATINGKNFLIVSFAAHDILDTLLYIMRQGAQSRGEETKISKLFSSIQTTCKRWLGSKRSRLICRIAAVSGKGGWYETSRDQEEQIASEVLRYLRKSLTYVGAAIPQNDETFEPLLSLYRQGPWDLKSSGKDEILEHLERVGIFTTVDDSIELRTRKEWAERHRARYSEGNNNSASRH